MINCAKYIIVIIVLLGCREKKVPLAKVLVQRQEAEIELIQETLQAYNSALYQGKIGVAIPYLSSGHRRQFDTYLSKAKQLNELNLYEEAIPDLSVLLRLLRAFSNDEFATLTNDDMYYGYLIEGMPVYNKMNEVV